MSNRQTGRTSNQLLACIEKARQGEIIVFLCPNDHNALSYAMPLLESLLTGDDWSERRARGEVVFRSGGRIILSWPDDDEYLRLRDLRVQVEIDHVTVLSGCWLDDPYGLRAASATEEARR